MIMKHPFSRLFNLGEKEENSIEQENPTNEPTVELDVNDGVKKEEVKHLPIKSIVPNRYQPRTVFAEDKIHELALTIRTHGIIQPIIVRQFEEDNYEIIACGRWQRRRASGDRCGSPAIIKEYSDTETASVALIENLQREELSAIEEAYAYGKLLELHNLTQEALAQRLGKGQSTIANKLRLLKLPTEIQEALMKKKVTERHARALIPLKHPEKQVNLLHEIIEKQLNVKQTEDRVVKLLENDKKKPKPQRKAFSRDTRIAMNTIRQSLTMVVDSGVSINSEEEEFDDYFQFTIKIPKK